MATGQAYDVVQADAVPFGTEPSRRVPPAQGVRLRLGRADRDRGDRERRPGVQAAGVAERRRHAHRHGRPARRPLHRDHLRRRRLRDRADRGRRARPSSPSSRARSSATGRPLFYLFQASTALILFLAANTSFNAFPRLAALLAEDGYMPRQFAFRGDRLAFSWGIVLLAAIAAGLIVLFGGDTHALIPLYCGRRVRLLHAVADRDGPPLARGAESGLVVAAGDQRRRRAS